MFVNEKFIKKRGFEKRKRCAGGYRNEGGIKAVPHNLALDIRRNRMLYVFLSIILGYFLVFHYIPMVGLLMAFEKYSPVKGIFGSQWVGLRHFKNFFTGPFAVKLIRNTVIIGLLDFAVNFPAPIIFALLLNEIKNRAFKKIVQTVSYMPYFISSVVVAGMIISFTKAGGIISVAFSFMTDHVSENRLNLAEWFRPIFVLSGTWQWIGYGSIVYLAALSGIDQGLYEAARIDGAGHWRQMWHVTLPGIMPMITMMLIMRMGILFNVAADKLLLLYNPANYEVSDVINTYIYRVGLGSMDYGMSTAVGLINSLIGTVLLLTSNRILKKTTGSSMF